MDEYGLNRRVFCMQIPALLFLPYAKEHPVAFLPLDIGNWHAPVLLGIEKEISNIYRVDARWESRQRISADWHAEKILDQIKSPEHILAVTSAPLMRTTEHGSIGVSGLAYVPGSAAVTTTFWRARKVSAVVARRRMLDVIVHELGHNFGADDCTDENCTMYDDPTGKNKHLDRIPGTYCARHELILQQWLR